MVQRRPRSRLTGGSRPMPPAGSVVCETGRPPCPTWSRGAAGQRSVIDDEAVALGLQSDQFEHRGGDEQRARDKVRMNVGEDIVGTLVVGIVGTGGRQTGGMRVRGLVSDEE